MALTDVNVVQMAVAHLGQTETVTNISSPTTKAEKLGLLFYAYVRDRLLAKHDWSFATRRAALTDVTATEAKDGWSYAYTLPSDLLRVIAIDLGFRRGSEPAGLDPVHPNLPGAKYVIEANAAGTGRVLLTDIGGATVKVVYSARITNLDLWDLDVVEVLAWAVAARLAMPMTTKPEVAEFAERMSRQLFAEAVADDANEQRVDPQETSEIITARAW